MTVAVDAFAGHGWGVAMRRLGIDERAIEWDDDAVATRLANGLSEPIVRDVWDSLAEAFVMPEHDLYVGSPPCQTFSQAGKGTGRKALTDVVDLIDRAVYVDPERLRKAGEALGDAENRTALVLAPLAHIHRHHPRLVVLEQVPTVLPVWQAYARELQWMGYSVWCGTLQAEQYGVPQTRKRAILIARRDGIEATPPPPTHSRYHQQSPERLDPDVLPWVSMAEALGWGMTMRPSITITGGSSRQGRPEPLDGGSGARRTLQRAKDDGTWLGDHDRRPTVAETAALQSYPVALDEQLGDIGPSMHLWRLVCIVRARMNDQSGTPYDPTWPAKRPALTIAGRGLVGNPGPTANRFNGSTKSRNDGIIVDPLEAAVLQSYPEGFAFEGSTRSQYLQVGNAVPPLLAEAILRHVVGS